MRTPDTAHAPYLLFTLVLSIFSLAILGASVALPLTSNTRHILDYADDGLCVVFFADFVQSLWRAQNRCRYFVSWGWIDLLSCIPTVDYLRAGRLVRIFRIFRVLRAIRSAKIIATFVLQRRAQGAMLAATLIGILLIVLASIGILHFEDVPGANITSAEDALWWTMETITTVGYGDRYPITTEGRVLASGLMVAGVGLIGIYTGYVAAWFLRPTQTEANDAASEISHLASRIAQLDEAGIKALAARMKALRCLLPQAAHEDTEGPL
jgi:voltage-gated potassium channel